MPGTKKKATKTGFVLLLLLLLIPASLYAQKKVTLSGYIRDSSSSETLIGATVYFKELQQAVQTNNYGFYSISVPAGAYTVIFSYVGYGTVTESLNLNESRTLDVAMQNKAIMKEVEITSTRSDENVKGTQMGTVSLSVDKVKTLPVIFGEVDVLKSLQLMPGVQSAGEGSSGFYVRGGGPDQNLVLLDDAVVYNTGHLFGFFSVFNSDAIKNVTLIKGGMPASYGGRLSSVVDVSMKDGNMKEYHAEGGIGLIASRLTLEGPIKKDKGSFMLAGRRTYIDVLVKPFVTGTAKNSGYFFYDANLKANYEITKKDRVYLSGYLGLDKFKFEGSGGNFKADIPWGNTTATLRYNHLFSDKLFSNTTLVYNDYKFASNFDLSQFAIKLSSGIRDWNGKTDFDYFTSFNHHFKAGVAYTYHTFIPNQVSGKADTLTIEPNTTLIKYAHELGAYIQDEFDITKWLRVNAGIRYSWFGQVGPYHYYTYDDEMRKTADSSFYPSGKLVQAYGGWEPRLNLNFSVSRTSSIKASVTKTYQYIHLTSNNGSTLPTDVWVPSTYVVKPQTSWQYSVGYFRNFLEDKLETSVEVYYKDMTHQIEYKDGFTPGAEDPEVDYVFGNGQAYGAEFLINKTRGRFTGWIGYTLSWTWRTFPDLNHGNRFPAKYDRRHDLSVVGTYELSPKWTVSGVFIYGSGNAITLPTNYYFVNGNLEQQNSDINAYRLFPYHRLDLSAIYKPKPKKKRRWQSSWALSVYNVYDRHNPYFLYVKTDGDVNNGVNVKVMAVSIFPILPSITYNFKF
jgi:hypothetical protein